MEVYKDFSAHFISIQEKKKKYVMYFKWILKGVRENFYTIT